MTTVNGITEAAYELVIQIVIFHEKYPKENINKIGLSNGGNVGIIATNILTNLKIPINNLVLIDTPNLGDIQLSNKFSGKAYIQWQRSYSFYRRSYKFKRRSGS